MLVNLKTVLEIAERNNTAIGSFNVTCLDSLHAVIIAAEELNVPVIIMHAEIHNTYNDISVIGPIMARAAENAKVPVCVHLDHGTSFEMIYRAIRIGFTSVMYDGSELPYDINVENTKKVVEISKPLGISVEAELGRMATREGGEPNADTSNFKPEEFYTVPSKAKTFACSTGIDALAIAFGTQHGFYKQTPVLDFDVIKNVRLATGGMPLVMHGGSGVSDEGFKAAIKSGIRKINYYSYMSGAGYDAICRQIRLGDSKYHHDLNLAARKAMKENTKKALEVFSS